MSGPEPIRRYAILRRRRRLLITVDLNVAPPCESRNQEGTSSHVRQDTQATVQPPIHVQAYDDDVVIASPRGFAEAQRNRRGTSRRTHPVVDVESAERASHSEHRRDQTLVTRDFFSILEARNSDLLDHPPPPPPPPRAPALSCPICMGPIVEPTTTKCGHIFCNACIRTAIATQAKCPTCRKRSRSSDIIRIYLPSPNASE